VGANGLLNPGALGGDYLDATKLAATGEIVVPPVRRSLEDNVAVEKLTIAGASQTLDGIRWTNVTFVGTRVKYAKGPLDMENVRFVNCTFDFPADESGSRLSNAIALGQTSFTAE
jgi:acyl dehydratase